jgi:SAM-dependent methyltransferase
VWEVIQGLGTYWSVAAAVELGLFERLAQGPATTAELAGGCGAVENRMSTLLGGLVAAGLVTTAGGLYELTEEARTFLVPGLPGYMGTLVLKAPGPHENWPVLADTVRGRPPPHGVETDGGSFHRELVSATFATQYRTGLRTADALRLTGSPAPLRILDLGSGAAPWTVALLEALPQSVAVVNDLPEVIGVAEEHLARRGLRQRVELLEGDYLGVALESDAFDVSVLAHVCRAEGTEGAERLVAKAVGALRPGGLLIVADYFVDDGRLGPPHALLLGVTMMASTRQGTTFTLSEGLGWLTAAGIASPEVLMPLPPTTVLAGRKPIP